MSLSMPTCIADIDLVLRWWVVSPSLYREFTVLSVWLSSQLPILLLEAQFVQCCFPSLAVCVTACLFGVEGNFRIWKRPSTQMVNVLGVEGGRHCPCQVYLMRAIASSVFLHLMQVWHVSVESLWKNIGNWTEKPFLQRLVTSTTFGRLPLSVDC